MAKSIIYLRKKNKHFDLFYLNTYILISLSISKQNRNFLFLHINCFKLKILFYLQQKYSKMKQRRIISEKFLEIRDYLLEKGIVKNRTEFASKIGTYTHTISKCEKGERNVPIAQIIKLIEKFGEFFNSNYLFGFEEDLNNIVFLTEATAGPSIQTEIERDFKGFKIPELRGELWAFKVKGDSMLPTLENGDILICREIRETSQIKDNQIYVVNYSEGINVKRVKLKKQKSKVIGVTLLSDNFEENLPKEIEFTQGLHDFPFTKFYLPTDRITKNGLS